MTQQNKPKGQSGRRPMSKEDGARVNAYIRRAVGRVARTTDEPQTGTIEEFNQALSAHIQRVVNGRRGIAIAPSVDGEAV